MNSIENITEGQVLLIDKPLHWTSFQVVNKMRFAIKKRFKLKKIKVGHAGTLDPLATGLLIICTGKYTKKIDDYQALFKEYTGTIKLGNTTPSYDLETDFNEQFTYDHISDELITKTTQQFIGEINQIPPTFSAIQKDGKRAYDMARKGQEMEMESRKVTVHQFEITRISLPEIDFSIQCSKGTYIRSIAHDFGKAMNSGSHLAALRRTKIGEFSVENALSLEQFLEQILEDN
ncbi:MAG: tRNA pseudouridine(55) synthase TruB [Flavobacteriaceae bacterium]|nr:tRNA pseudouridine(55) synthase TruB [Flavobacteriaceae bacterium]